MEQVVQWCVCEQLVLCRDVAGTGLPSHLYVGDVHMCLEGEVRLLG